MSSATLLELRLEPDGLSGRITCPPGLNPAPGQYLVASSAASFDPLPVALFPSRISAGVLSVAAPLPAAWAAGMTLSLRGPLGRGFRLPPTARRVALASLESSPSRLLPLADLALAQYAAVAIYAAFIPYELPEEVEVLPPDLLPEAPGWADYLALDACPDHLPDLRARLKLPAFQQPACEVQVLVAGSMPCSGLGECGVCAVSTRKGWALACSDGPVFDFHELEGV